MCIGNLQGLLNSLIVETIVSPYLRKHQILLIEAVDCFIERIGVPPAREDAFLDPRENKGFKEIAEVPPFDIPEFIAEEKQLVISIKFDSSNREGL